MKKPEPATLLTRMWIFIFQRAWKINDIDALFSVLIV